jgi:hypothetical protein
LQSALRALNKAALVQQLFCRAIGMKDGAMFVGQQDGTPKRIDGFRHPLAHDGSDIKHLADRHLPPQMRQQQLLSSISRSVMRPCLSFRPTPNRDRCTGSPIKTSVITSTATVGV